MLSRSRVLVLLILLIAFALRVTVAHNNLTTALAPDEREYLGRAVRVAENIWADRAIFRPPLYPYALALVFNTLGQARFLVGAFHAFADVISVALMYALTGALVRRRNVALVAALLYAVSPTALGLVGSLLSDTLFICLTLTAFVLTLRAAAWKPIAWTGTTPHGAPKKVASILLAALAGLFFALAALAREVIAYFALVVIPVWWLVFAAAPRWTRVAQTAALLVGMGALLVPWVARNQIVADRFLLLSSSSEFNFARDNVRVAMLLGAVSETAASNNALNQKIRGELDAQPPNARAAYAYRRGLEAIAATGPAWLLYKAESLGAFWNPFQIEKTNLGINGLPASWIPTVSLVVSGYWAAALLFAIVGFVAKPDPASKLLVALFLLYSFALFLLTHYQLRYRFPPQTFMLPYAAYGMWVVSEMARRRTLIVPQVSRRRVALALVPLTLSLILMAQAAAS